MRAKVGKIAEMAVNKGFRENRLRSDKNSSGQNE
jgi:hypothetical protein